MNWPIRDLLQVSLSDVTYPVFMRILLLISLLALAACNTSVYTKDGVTDGDTFYLAPHAWVDDDPALQSWVAYSLVKSTCQLEVGGDTPSRTSDYGCELMAREHLLDTWEEQREEHRNASDPYLDALLRVRRAGFLDEYTLHYFGKPRWTVPARLKLDDFHRWQHENLRRHTPQTRLIGSWNYRKP